MTALPLRQRPAWVSLERHFEEIKALHLRDLFARDSTRGLRLRAQAEGLFLDYSKNRVTDETMRLLFELARESELAQQRDRMFRPSDAEGGHTGGRRR
jgi:glucose-6-phosphate isomerase